jgi:uncharacterized membrane protein
MRALHTSRVGWLTGDPNLHSGLRRTVRLGANPVLMFIVLSALFGTAVLIINPPLRGPDETAHFLRVIGILHGDIMPSLNDESGRKGTLVPASIYDDLSFFERARQEFRARGVSYGAIAAEYLEARRKRSRDNTRPPIFTLYQGSESYSPIPYIPYLMIAGPGEWLGFDFLSLLYAMRIAGFVAMAALAAYAIWIVPHLKWAFVLIAMLPSALYGRSVIGADGATLTFTLLATALCLRGATDERSPYWQRAAFMTLCVLCKPPQIAWTALELMVRPWRRLPHCWPIAALVVLPGLLGTALWTWAGAGDVGAWRVIEGTHTPAELFGPARKLAILATDPLLFPRALFATLGAWEAVNLWRQLIGVLGWLDTSLQDWAYPSLSALLVASWFAPLPLSREVRYRIAAASLIGVVAYILLVYGIFYLTWTPIGASEIWGVQGRYFVVVLPPVALAVAALANRGPAPHIQFMIAMLGSVLSGVATLEALFRVNW